MAERSDQMIVNLADKVSELQRENTRLQGELKNERIDHAAAEKHNDELIRKYARVESENTRQAEEIARKDAAVRDMAALASARNAEAEVLRLTNTRLEKERDAAKAKLDVALAGAAENTRRRLDAEDANTRQGEEVERLKGQLKESHRRHTEAEALLADANGLNTPLKEALRGVVEWLSGGMCPECGVEMAPDHDAEAGGRDGYANEDCCKDARERRADLQALLSGKPAVDGTPSDKRSFRPPEDAPTAPSAAEKAFTEGRLAGLREAARVAFEMRYLSASGTWLAEDIENRIRDLIGKPSE